VFLLADYSLDDFLIFQFNGQSRNVRSATWNRILVKMFR